MNECNNAGRALFAPSPFGGPPRSLARVSRQPAEANSAKGPRQADGVPGAARAVADGYQVLPSDIVKYHLGLLRRSSSLLKSCTLRRVLRLLQTFLDSHSHFDAQRVISRVVYNAEERACACSEAAVKVVRRWVFSGYLARPLCPDSALTRAAVRFARSLARSLVRSLARYTVTHSDETGVLTTSVGAEYDARALNSLKQQLFRDRVLGERVLNEDAQRGYTLVLYAYVAGKRLLWPCPPAVRSYIFQRWVLISADVLRTPSPCLSLALRALLVRSLVRCRDMNLVVESILHADADLLESLKDRTSVEVHLESDSFEDLDEVVVFAQVLGDRSTWALGASDSSKNRLVTLRDKLAAAMYSFLVLQKDKKNDACGEACNVSCSLGSSLIESLDD